ncbi:MAG TPA: MaoC family dehydratase [Euzebyales bacterium]|nr:MaoC family dehydratase [Euzebyales bacterium]
MGDHSTASEVWPGGAPATGDTASMQRTVTTRDIELFSEISGDFNPLHYDEAYAAASPFGGIVVQGGVTTAILNAVVAQHLPGPGSVFLNLTLDFRAPVRPGDTITGRVEVVEVRADKPIASCRVSVTRDDDVTAVEGTAVTWTMPPPALTERPDRGPVTSGGA